MRNERAREQSLHDVKAIPILEVAEALGVRVKGTSAQCPFIGHEDRNPSFSIYPADNRCWCHRCNNGGSPIDLVALSQGLSASQAIAWLRSRFLGSPNVSMPPARRQLVRPNPRVQPAKIICKPNSEIYRALLELCPLGETAKAYLKSRHFTAKTIQHFKLGALANNASVAQALITRFGRSALVQAGLLSEGASRLCFIAPSILFPFYVRGELAYLQARALPGSPGAKWVGLRGIAKPVFNFDVIAKARSIYICEGATDVLSVHQMGRAAIGLLGGMSALPSEVVESLSGREIYLVPDKDDVGAEMVNRLKGQLLRAGISAIVKQLDVGADVNERLIIRGTR